MENKETKTTIVEKALNDGILNVSIVERKDEPIKHLDPKPPIKLSIQGTIYAPALFVEKRVETIKPLETNIQYSIQDGFIELFVNESNHYEIAFIKGKLEKSKDLNFLKINKDEYFSPKQMAKMLRKVKYLFASQEQAISVIASLNNFKAKVDREYNNQDNQRGTIKKEFNQIVESNIPSGFALNMPIFKGFQKQLINVEIEIDENVNCCLYSDDLIELEQQLKENTIKEELKKLNEYVQIEV